MGAGETYRTEGQIGLDPHTSKIEGSNDHTLGNRKLFKLNLSIMNVHCATYYFGDLLEIKIYGSKNYFLYM